MASATGIERNRTVLGTDPARQARLSTTVEHPAAGRCLSRSSDWRVRVMAREPAQLKSGYLQAAITALSAGCWVLDIVFQSTGSPSTSAVALALTTTTAPPATPWAVQTASSDAISLSTIVTLSAT